MDAIVRKCMSQEAAQRYNSAAELREALLYDGYEEEPDNPKGWFTRNVAAVVFIIAVALVFLGWEPIVNSFKTDSKPAANVPLAAPEKESNDPTYSDPLLGGAAPKHDFALQISDEKSLSDPSANENAARH